MAGFARRTVLRGGMVIALATVTGAAHATAARAVVDVGAVTREAFEDAVGGRATFTGPGGVAAAKLIAVTDLQHAPAGHPDAFAVQFRLDQGAAPAHGLADVELPGLRVTGLGLLAQGAPADRSVLALIDRRPVSEHLTQTTVTLAD